MANHSFEGITGFCLPTGAAAQGEFNIWTSYYNGSGQFLPNRAFWDFNYRPVRISKRATTPVNSAYLLHSNSICDPCGRFLYATDGRALLNEREELIANGDSLNGQPVDFNTGLPYNLILPKPLSRDEHYVFTRSCAGIGCQLGFYKLLYAVVDRRGNGGQGQVVQKKVVLNDALIGDMTATAHANGKDFWVVTREKKTGDYLAFQLTERGVAMQPVRSVSRFPTDSNALFTQISPDGRWIASTGPLHAGSAESIVSLAFFDAFTGRVSSAWELFRYGSSTGALVEFSPDGRGLFAVENTLALYRCDELLTQYDLRSADSITIRRSRRKVPGVDCNPSQLAYTYFLSLASHGQLLVAVDGWIGSILNPNTQSATIKTRVVDASRLAIGVPYPRVVNSMLLDTLPQIRYLTGCASADTTQFWLANPGCAESVTWQFDDPASGPANTAAMWYPKHRFSGPGRYQVVATTDNGTVYRTEVVIGPDAMQIQVLGGGCGADTVELGLTRTDCLDSIRWQFDDPDSGPANQSSDWRPTHVFSRPGNYTVTATLSNGRTLRRPVAYDPRPTLAPPPNIITPNQDGLNDTFRPLGASVLVPADYRLRIYNRWGTEVFSSTDPAAEWDAADVSAGVYYYQLTAVDCAQRPVYWRGPLTVIR